MEGEKANFFFKLKSTISAKAHDQTSLWNYCLGEE